MSACLSWPINATQETHEKVDAWAKANGLTVTYAGWHPKPEYRAFKTGDLPVSEYPSGLILVDRKGIPRPFSS